MINYEEDHTLTTTPLALQGASIIPPSHLYLSGSLLCLSLTLLLTSCGEVEEVKNASTNTDPGAPQRYSATDFSQVIEPLLAELSCDNCHGNPLGGFKWDPAGTPAASDSNQLNVQRAMSDAQPSASPMLVRLSLPKVDGHPRYYCVESCLYQYLLAWGTESIGPVDYDAIECVEVSQEDIAEGQCPEG